MSLIWMGTPNVLVVGVEINLVMGWEAIVVVRARVAIGESVSRGWVE